MKTQREVPLEQARTKERKEKVEDFWSFQTQSNSNGLNENVFFFFLGKEFIVTAAVFNSSQRESVVEK